MYRTSRLVLCCTALVVAACAKKEAPEGHHRRDGARAAPAPAPAPALAAADVAGTWHFAAVPTTGKDTSATTFDLAATADSADWTMTFTKSKLKVPAKHSISGDTLTITAGPFASQRRKGAEGEHGDRAEDGRRQAGR